MQNNIKKTTKKLCLTKIYTLTNNNHIFYKLGLF